MRVCACECACRSAERSLHPETDEYFPLVCWLLNRLLGKVLEQHFLGEVKIFCVFMWVLREEYFTLHGTSDTPKHDLFITRAIKAPRVRGLRIPVAFDRYASSNCQIFVTAALRVPVESPSQICIIAVADRSWSLMLPSWILHGAELDRWYSRYAARWKLISCNAVRHLIWTCSFPHHSPGLTRNQACHTGVHVHVMRAWGQLTHSCPILPSASQHEQSPCCYETNFL